MTSVAKKYPFWVQVAINTMRSEFGAALLKLPPEQRTPILLAALEADGIVNREVDAGNWHPGCRENIIQACVFDKAREILRKLHKQRR